MFLAAGTARRRELFVESRDRQLDSVVRPLPGYPESECSLVNEDRSFPMVRQHTDRLIGNR